MAEIEIPGFKCIRCEHKWAPRTNRKPVICPKCKSPYWDRARDISTKRQLPVAEVYGLHYPEHESIHGPENAKPDEERIWACEECLHIFTDTEIREDLAKGWAHSCKHHPCRKGQRCESHLEPYKPELGKV